MIGELIKQLRKQRGWTQTELANRTGLNQGHIADLENGKSKNPTQTTLAGLAFAFDLTVSDLLTLAGMALPGELNELRVEGVPADALSRLARMWLDLTPADRDEVVALTRRLWEQRTAVRAQAEVSPEAIGETS